MRHLTLVGVIRNKKVLKLARQCAWCRKWASVADMQAAHRDGAKVSHGMCDRCAKRFLEKMASECPPPEAA